MIGPICLLAFASDTVKGQQCGDLQLRTDFFEPAEGINNMSTIDGRYFTSTELRKAAPLALNASLDVKRAFTKIFPALTAFGVTHLFLDYLPGAVHSLRTNPRVTEVLNVLGRTYSVDLTDTTNELCKQTFRAGELFVLLEDLVNWQNNDDPGKAEVEALSAFRRANPGVKINFASVFGSGINHKILATAFNVTRDTVRALEAPLATT